MATETAAPEEDPPGNSWCAWRRSKAPIPGCWRAKVRVDVRKNKRQHVRAADDRACGRTQPVKIVLHRCGALRIRQKARQGVIAGGRHRHLQALPPFGQGGAGAIAQALTGRGKVNKHGYAKIFGFC